MQTEKQRLIWAYKILFLDVLFPLGLKKVIFLDADQIIRTDIAELWNMDLKVWVARARHPADHLWRVCCGCTRRFDSVSCGGTTAHEPSKNLKKCHWMPASCSLSATQRCCR